MESRLDQLTEINRIRNNEQVLTWVKNFETNFRKDLANARNVKSVHIEKTPEELRKDAKEAIAEYTRSFREEAATIPRQDRQEVER